MDLLHSWSPEKSVKMLEGTDLNLAVAKGASIYGAGTTDGKGIRIRCSHLRKTKHATDPHWECDIYEDRPQLCRDFNCVSWAKYSGDLTQYNRVLEKMGLNSNKLMKDLELKGSTFSKELQGPDL